jgi:AraC family transcriptional regulator of adaptative response / DNA-3-methyladenine glycosylase II
MKLDHNQCYAILKSRDERFDGRFFAGVLTTGIYCRPICPATKPKPENVRFFVTAAAAEASGLRPCLRCRPESSPGTPDWYGTSATVSRAMRLISEGVMDEAGVDEVAERLHVGTRQLRRLFVQHLGAPPVALAQNRRLLFAKKLITETSLPMSEIAFSAGYSSIRRFNEALLKSYGVPPTELRSANGAIADQTTLQLKLAYRPPYQWEAMRRFLGARAIPGVERVDATGYARTVKVGDATGAIQIRPAREGHSLLLTVSPNLTRELSQLVGRARRLFDLSADPMEIGEHLAGDEMLAPLVRERPGLRVPGAWNGFEVAIRAILGQQVSVKAASTLCGRLVRRYGQALETPPGDGLSHLFPNPDRLAEADLAGLGMSSARAGAIQALSKAVAGGELILGTAGSLEEVIEQLTEVPGIGAWTAHYIAMRVYGEPDAFPAGDLALRRALAGEGEKEATAAAVEARSQSWRPWRAYAAMHLWEDYRSRQGDE